MREYKWERMVSKATTHHSGRVYIETVIECLAKDTRERNENTNSSKQLQTFSQERKTRNFVNLRQPSRH